MSLGSSGPSLIQPVQWVLCVMCYVAKALPLIPLDSPALYDSFLPDFSRVQ